MSDHTKLETLIDALAIGVGNGFKRINEQFESARSDLATLRGQVDAVHSRLDQVDQTLKPMDARLERVESLATGQSQRVDILEDRVRQLATRVGYQFN